MSLADNFRDNAADCAFMADRTEDEDSKHALMRMEAAWCTLGTNKKFWTVNDGRSLPDRRPFDQPELRTPQRADEI
jgi:hypothetical protein